MAYKTLKVTEDHITLLQAIKFESFVFDGDSRNGRIGWGIDQYAPWGGNYPIEDIALVLGVLDKAIPGTEDDVDGRKFPVYLEDKLFRLYNDVTDNMEDYFSLLVSQAGCGGLKPGYYKCNPRYRDWKYSEPLEDEKTDE